MHLETEIWHHLRRLCVDVGPRPGGSQANHTAAAYIAGVFRAAGLEVEEQPFTCPVWEHEETRLELAGQPVPAAANAFSLPCDVAAPSVAVGTLAELEAATLAGRVGVLYGDLTRAPLSPKAWFLRSERDERVVRLLEEKRPAALITVYAGEGELPRLIEDAEFDVPSVTVPAGVGLALVGERPAVHLRIHSRRSMGTSLNVVARQSGAGGEGRGRLVLCAHYDTKVDTPGAMDNAAGVAVLLVLARQLSRTAHALDLEWVAFSNEEALPLGDDEYVRRRGDAFDHMVAAINFDGVGHALGATSITALAAAPAFEQQMQALAGRYPGVVWAEPWPQSNHSTFAWRGVPSLAFTTQGGASLAHTRADTIEWISPVKLDEAVSLAVDVVESLQERAPAWGRPDPAAA